MNRLQLQKPFDAAIIEHKEKPDDTVADDSCLVLVEPHSDPHVSHRNSECGEVKTFNLI